MLPLKFGLPRQKIRSGYRPDHELTVLNYLLFKYPISVKLKSQIQDKVPKCPKY